MATTHKFDPAAPGAFEGYPPLKSNPLTRNSEQNHRLGEIMLTPAGIWRYTRFGENVDPGDIVAVDEMWGAPRTDGDGAGANKDNRAYKVTDNPANGATLRQLGIVVDVGAKAGEYGWVLADQGFAKVNARRDAAEGLSTWANKAVAAADAVPAQDVLPLGCDEEAGRICPFDRAGGNTLIFGIEIDEVSDTGAAADQKFQVRAFIRSPYAKTKTAYDMVAQPVRAIPNFGDGPVMEQ